MVGSRRVDKLEKLLVIKEKSFLCYLVSLRKQLVHSSTYSVFFASNSFTRLTCLLVHFITNNLFTRLLVHSSTYNKTVQRSLWTLARYVTNAMELLLRRFSSLTPQPGRNSVGGYIQGKQLEPSCR